VIKVIWGARGRAPCGDVEGVLLARMNETVDGEFQKYATESGAYIREALLRFPTPACGHWSSI